MIFRLNRLLSGQGDARPQSLSLRRGAHLLVLFACLLALAPAASASAPSASLTRQPRIAEPDAASVKLRIGVVKDGIVALSPLDLAVAGVKVGSVDPRTFAMQSLGQPVAILVTGESDGIFDGADRLYFFGQKFRGVEMDQKYTDERVYWLEAGGTPGLRIQNVSAQPQNNLTPPTSFATTLRAEDSMYWWTLNTLALDTYDTWFWARSQPLRVGPDAVITATLPFTIPHPGPGSNAAFRLEQISRVDRWDINPDHRTTVRFNGAPLLDQTWDGLKKRMVFAATVPAAALQHGVNQVAVGAWTLPGINSDDIYTNYWELDYRREFRAYLGQLDFKAETAGAQEYEVAGWEAGPVWAWDISDPNQPRQLAYDGPALDYVVYLPLTVRGGGATPLGQTPTATTIRFRAAGAVGARYWLQAGPTFAAPASIKLRAPTTLRSSSNRVDAVLVTASYLKDATQTLAAWHEAQGRRALIVDIQDIYDEFNDGIQHPKAIRALLQWAASNWQAPAPQYLTLVGDGHWNFKGYNPALYPPQPNPIPPLLAWVDPWQGEVPVDSRLGDLNSDGSPEIAVGRLPVNTPAEAQVVIQKIVNYNQGTRSAAWQKRALFIADNADYQGDFPAVTKEVIANNTPPDLQPIPVYLSEAPVGVPVTSEQIIAARTAISSNIQSGVLMIQFAGHGAPERWAHELIWRTSDIPGLTNGSMLPVVMTFNCLDGYFVHPSPSTFSMAELMLRKAGGGSVAAISPTGLGTTDIQHEFRKILLDVMFKDNVRELGRALTIAKQKFFAKYGAHYLIDTMTLFGDPALRLPAQGAQ